MGSTEASSRMERIADIVRQLLNAGFPDHFIDELIQEHIVVDLQTMDMRRRQAELN